MRRASALLLLLASLALFASCLPGSQRKQTRGVTAADSLSREVAAAVPVDTLALVRRITPPDSPELEYPMTLAFAGDDLYVLDQEEGHLSAFEAATGDRTRIVTPEVFAYPLIAGLRGDTLAVLSREDATLHFVHDGQVVRTVDLPPASYATALVTEDAIYLKSVDQEAGTDEEEAGTYLAVVDEDGAVRARYGLAGPWWRHLGYVRPWGDAVLSLSGFRPVVDVLVPPASEGATPAGATLDTLALVGFDSPLLNTSLRFMRDEVREPPLLAASARALGDTLYVLNLRPGLLRIDAYAMQDGEARLQRAYEYQAVPDEQDPLALFPTDLDVRRTPTGALEFAVLLKDPSPAVLLLRPAEQRPSAPGAAEATP